MSDSLILYFYCEKFQRNLTKVPILGNFIQTFDMGRNTSVSLGDYFEDFVEAKISEGRFKNASEVIRAGLRLLEEEEQRIIALREAVQQGISSGIDRSFDSKKHLANLKARKK